MFKTNQADLIDPSKIKCIAVWNTAFMGDAILTLPLIQQIKGSYPQAKIHYFVRKDLKELFAEHKDIFQVHEFDKKNKHNSLLGMYALGKELAKYNFDIWLSAHQSFRTALMAYFSKAKVKIGYSDFWYNNLFYTATVSRDFKKKQEIERLLKLAEPLLIHSKIEANIWANSETNSEVNIKNFPEIYVSAQARQKATDFWQKFTEKKVLGIHPGSIWLTKRWPISYFAQIAAKAMLNNISVIVFGTATEKELADQVTEQAKILVNGLKKHAPASFNIKNPAQDRNDLISVKTTEFVDYKEPILCSENIYNLAGKLSLIDLAAYFEKLTCYLGNDSGPMHLAWSLGVQTFALFGPTTKDLGFMPRKNSTVLEMDLACRPCGLHGHQKCPKGHHYCMQNLTPEYVWDELLKSIYLE